MTFTPEYIDSIVQNVLRGLKSGGAVSTSAPPESGTDVLVIQSRLVTEAVLHSVGAAGRTVSFAPGTVVTPSGRDFIRRHSVRVVTQAVSAAKTATGRVVAVQAPAAVAAAVTAAGWMLESVDSATAAVRSIAGAGRGDSIVFVGKEAAVVACLLNRDPRNRAAVISRLDELTTLIPAMSPNIWCITGSGWSFGDLLKLLRSLPMSGAAPSAWTEIAGGSR